MGYAFEMVTKRTNEGHKKKRAGETPNHRNQRTKKLRERKNEVENK